MIKNTLSCLLLVMLSLMASPVRGEDQLVEDLREEWQVFSSEEKAFVPYIAGVQFPKMVHLFLDVNRYSDYYLKVFLPAGTSFLVENKLVTVVEKHTQQSFRVDSLQAYYQKDRLLVSFYSAELPYDLLQTQIVDVSSAKSWESRAGVYDIDVREQGKENDFLILSILTILVVVVFVKRTLKNVFFDYLSFDRAFSIKPRGEGLFTIGVFSQTNLLMLLLYGVTLGFTFTVVFYVLTDWLTAWFGVLDTLKLFGIGLVFSLLCIGAMVVKYFLIYVMSLIYKLKKYHLIQFYDYLRMTIFLVIVFFCVSIFNLSTEGYYLAENKSVFLLLAVLTLLLRPIFMFLKLNKLSGYKNLHLFSYICGTEIIPLIIILKFFLN